MNILLLLLYKENQLKWIPAGPDHHHPQISKIKLKTISLIHISSNQSISMPALSTKPQGFILLLIITIWYLYTQFYLLDLFELDINSITMFCLLLQMQRPGISIILHLISPKLFLKPHPLQSFRLAVSILFLFFFINQLSAS